ncbi:amidase domain-containing protein [Desnuesiella massiliensis]|uniref:amidase domain-containing protein n=1 Tax=Desnuesiella massiliensis TaxID=1650662 RepID=UPI0006E22885|nr:amidase domain-containing protein [Desnuesiella massiliensis]
MRRIRKLIGKFCITSFVLFVVMLANSIQSVHAGVDRNYSDDEQIKSLINNYFALEFEELKYKDVKYTINDLVDNGSLSKFKATKLKLDKLWYKKISDNIKDYKLCIDYLSLDINDDEAIVTLRKSVDFSFENSPEIVQKIRNEEHKVYLKKHSGKWKIKNDYYNNILLGEEFQGLNNSNALESKTALLEENIRNIEEIVKKFSTTKYNNNSNQANAMIYSNYYGPYAASYAIRYAEDYNLDYSNYNGKGGDCTNFVSQALLAGGLPSDSTWYKDSNAWIRVIELRNWLINKGYATEHTWNNNCKEGDVIQFYNNAYKEWRHSVIITYRRPDSGLLFVSGHAPDVVNVSVSYFFQYNANLTDTRYLRLTS